MNRFYHFRVVPSVLQLSTVVGLRWRLRMLFSFRVFMTPNFLCIIVHEMAFFFLFFVSRSLDSLLTNPFFCLFFISCRNTYLLLRLLTVILSPFLPPTVFFNPSISLSVYLSPLFTRHHSFSSGDELLCLPSASCLPPVCLLPSHSILDYNLSAITAYLLPRVSCRVHQILSAWSGTMATRKFFSVTLILVSVQVCVYVALMHASCQDVSMCLGADLVCALARLY